LSDNFSIRIEGTRVLPRDARWHSAFRLQTDLDKITAVIETKSEIQACSVGCIIQEIERDPNYQRRGRCGFKQSVRGAGNRDSDGTSGQASKNFLAQRRVTAALVVKISNRFVSETNKQGLKEKDQSVDEDGITWLAMVLLDRWKTYSEIRVPANSI
jgi:hypothetical protein